MGSVRVSSSDINTAVTWWHLFGHHGEEGAALGLEGPVDVVHREATWGAFKYVGVEPLRAPSPHPHTQAVPHVGGPTASSEAPLTHPRAHRERGLWLGLRSTQGVMDPNGLSK